MHLINLISLARVVKADLMTHPSLVIRNYLKELIMVPEHRILGGLTPFESDQLEHRLTNHLV